MSLKDLNKELYKNNSSVEGERHEKSEFNPEVSYGAETVELEKEKKWMDASKKLKPKQRRIVLMGFIITASIMAVAAMVIGVIIVKNSAFSEERVGIEIVGPDSVSSTDLVKYEITFKNENRISLKNAEILLNYSENFQPIPGDNIKIDNVNESRIIIGNIRPGSMKKVELVGSFYAPKDSVIFINATLNYSPANFNSTFQVKSKLGVNIKTSPLLIEVDAPFEAVDGDEVEYAVSYKNTGQKNLDDLTVKIEFPKDFEFNSSQPESTDGNNLWYIGRLDPGQEGRISIKGVIHGLRNEARAINALLGSSKGGGDFLLYSQRERVTKMVGSPLFIGQLIKNKKGETANAGEKLDYIIEYGNIGEIGLRKVIINVEIEGDVVDFANLDVGNGFYDSSKKMVTWRASDIPELKNIEPGQTGKIEFSIDVLKNFPVKNKNDKNFIIRTLAKIDSPDVPTPIDTNKIISSDEMKVKLNSKMILDIEGYHEDSNEIKNFGPDPPVIGEETSYTLNWKVTNVSNDVSNVKVVSHLPSGVIWKNKTYPESEKVVFNERTNEIIWDIGDMENGKGVLNSPREISFQISVVPQVNREDNIEILRKSIITAKDKFTNEDLEVVHKETALSIRESSEIN